MRVFYSILLLVAFAIPASAANLVCTVPAANVPRSVELCEELRLNLHVRSSEWNNNVCASQFLRAGLLQAERKFTERQAKTFVATSVNNAVRLYESTWDRPTTASCGDGILDNEAPWDEECDDGNTISGDGCNSSCDIEV